MRIAPRFALVVLCILIPITAFAQNWSFDARTSGMGGVGGSGNLATKMIEEQSDYFSIIIPIGLIQVFSNTNRFDPNSKEFDPILAVEYAASPMNYVIGRDSSSHAARTLFVNDLRNATVSRDLTKYKGFVPANSILAEGLVSPNFGGTIKIVKGDRGMFHGIYVGAGPYLSAHSLSTISTGLTNVLATGVNQPNAAFPMTEGDQGQVALAITGGYRGRFPWPMGIGSGADRDGLYVALNYNYLRGFAYTQDDMTIGLLTDRSGLITNTSGISIVHHDSSKGNGAAVDMGIGAVIGPWQFGFGARGIANRITWTGVQRETLTLANLTSSNSDFVESTKINEPDTRVELPVDYRGDVAYHLDDWAFAVEAGHGFGGGSFHGGVERRFGQLALRGGARYTVSRWNPTGGIGFDFSKRVGIDVAAYGTTANIEQERKVAIAASLRFNIMK